MGCILSDGKQDYVAANGYFDKCECLNRGSNLVNLNKSQNLILLGSYVEAEKLLKERILAKIVAIEDRSTKIITNILLICLRYLNKDGANPNNETLIKDFLRLLELKDSKLVEWNFQNLLKSFKPIKI